MSTAYPAKHRGSVFMVAGLAVFGLAVSLLAARLLWLRTRIPVRSEPANFAPTAPGPLGQGSSEQDVIARFGQPDCYFMAPFTPLLTENAPSCSVSGAYAALYYSKPHRDQLIFFLNAQHRVIGHCHNRAFMCFGGT